MKINENFSRLKANYLFSDIAKKVNAYKAANPDADIIRLGIGDVTRPLPAAVVEAMKKACDEMGREETFRGYPPEYGYDFLRHTINENDYRARGVELDDDEIFVSDGAKSDCGNIVDIFDKDNLVAVCDPVYPVYVDSNVMSGREKFLFLDCLEENNFVPQIPSERVDIIYLCFPNNPTGVSITKDELKKWVDYANEFDSVILFDSAYEAFIRTENVVHSIYEIEGAKTCAIEFRSFSKTAGFTGTRCGYTVVPHELRRGGVELASLWARRQATKFNGVSYITQRGAEAVYSDEGKKQVLDTIEFYRGNAKTIYDGLKDAGFTVYGGVDSPYVWLKTPENMTSWEFFDCLLDKVRVVGTPGSGFGTKGEGFFRLTSFGNAENTKKAVERIQSLFGK